MSQADGYVRIVTRNDTSEAQRSTEQLGDTIHDALDTSPADNMTGAVGGLKDGISDTGDAALKTGDIIKANLVSEAVTQGIQKLGEVLKESASRTIEIADGLDGSVNKIAAATNASAKEIEKLRSAVEQIYGDNFGEGFEDIADSIAKIKQNLGELDDKELVEVTESAYALKDVFDYDIAESSRAVKAMMENFGISALEAYDYIARGAQNGLDYSGELLDNISEYSVQFKKMGLSASDMFTIFSNGAENGAWNLDKIGDSVKELAIRVIDGSDTSKQGFEALGFEADSMAERFAAGGVSARVAFQEVITALAAMTDPVAQNTAGINLMGTMWEDMGAQAVLALGDISDSAYDCAGAMDGIKDVNYSSLSNSLDNVKRQIDLLIEPIGEELIPVLDEAADSVAEIAQKGDLKEIAAGVGSFVSGTLSFLLKNINLIASAVTGVTASVIAFKAANELTKVIASWQTAALQVTLLGNAQGAAAIKTAALSGELTAQEIIYGVLSGKLDIATAKTIALNTAMSMNPAGAIAAVIGILATAITGIALASANASENTNELNDSLNALKSTTQETISGGEAELEMLKKKVDRYDALRMSVNLTASEHEELSRLASDIQDTLGDEAQVVNSLTGEYNDLSSAVDRYVEKRHAELLQSAYEQEATEALKQIRSNQREADQLSEELFDLTNFDESDSPEADGLSKEGYSRIDEIQKRLKQIEDENLEYQKIVDEYDSIYSSNITSSGAGDVSYPKVQQEQADNAEMYKKLRADAKYSYDMGVIEADEYYTQLALLRDKYLEPDSEEWRAVNVEIKKYYDTLSETEKKAYDERLAAQKKADADAIAARKATYNKKKSDLEFQLKTGQITEDKYYSKLAKIRDKYLDKDSEEWRAAYLEEYNYRKKVEQESAEAEQKKTEDAAAARKNAYTKKRAELDFLLKTDQISEEKYYARLAKIRDKYLDEDSEEWRSAYIEEYNYKKRVEQESADAEQKQSDEAAAARKAAYAKKKSELEFQLKTGQITEEKYYARLAKIRDKYLDKNSAEWRSAYLEAYEYNQRILQENKDALEQLLNDASNSTLNALSRIVSARDSMMSKLTDFNKTFEKITETVPETVAVAGKFTITTAEHDEETYKMGADSIEDNIRVLEEYGDMLDALKVRGADESTLDSILGMDIEEGMEFGAKLLKMSDREWKSYFDSLDKLHKTAEEISAKYYQDQVNDLRENFVDKLRQELEGLGTDMYSVGADVAAEFVRGWNEALGTKELTIGGIMPAVSGGTLSTAPTAAQGMIAPAVSSLIGVTKTVSQIFKIPVYIGTKKLEEITVDALNGCMIQNGKNVLLT